MRTLLVATGSLALLLGGAAVAVADGGDGREACSAGEICFDRTDQNRYIRHFWYSDDNHGNDFWWDSTLNQRLSVAIQNDVRRLRNRDTRCTVRVINNLNLRPDVYQDVPNNGEWTVLRDGVRNSNDKHERCPR